MATKFSVMTWNVENLFPPGVKISPGKFVTEADYQDKLKYLAKRIVEMKPDVLGLQELGSRNNLDSQSLSDLQNMLGGKYPFMALASKTDGRGIRVGFLSKLKIHSVAEIVDFPAGEFESVLDWAGKKTHQENGTRSTADRGGNGRWSSSARYRIAPEIETCQLPEGRRGSEFFAKG